MQQKAGPARPSIVVTYRVRAGAAAIEERARAIAVEQSVEMPVAAITDAQVLDGILGRVVGIAPAGEGAFDVRVDLAQATTGLEAGQLFNMLFGNTSIHDDVTLQDMEAGPELVQAFGGPRHGIEGLRARVGAGRRALTCSALKPQGMPPEALAALAGRLALGRLDYIKDDHGLADQAYSPFAARVAVVAGAIARAADATAKRTRYVPSLAGTLDDLRRQVDICRAHGLDTIMIAPMVVGVPSFAAVVREAPDMAVMTHPALAGAARIAPPLHFGRLFRMLGADAVVYPNHGGRFGYTAETCRAIAQAGLAEWHGLRGTLAVPAGGMTLDRVPEMLDFYGPDVMLLIGGGLLAAGDRLTEETAAFVDAVEGYSAATPVTVGAVR